jgi:CubicO group peptidase (beta-lactamase class C family)
VERLNGGISLGEYMGKHIWGSLGMTSTTFDMESRPDLKAHKVDMTLRLPTGQLIHLPTPVYPSPAQDDCGGVGGYSTAPDYMKLLTSLLRDDGKLLTNSSIEEMFRPQLPDPKYLEQVLQIPELHSVLAGNFPKGLKVNHGLGGMLNMEPLPTGRCAGAMQWGGMPNLSWVSKMMLKVHYAPINCVNSGSIARAGCVGHTSHNSCLQEIPRPYVS